jgi:polysaccharide export outer membrane protein
MPIPSLKHLLAILGTAIALAACGSSAPYVWVQQLPRAAPEPVRLRVGDKVQVAVLGQEGMSGEFEVRPTGDLVLPQIGALHAENQTVDAFQQLVRTRLAQGILQNPAVTVVLASRRPPLVSIMGEVKNPGRYELRAHEGVIDALARCGGFTPFANTDKVYVLAHARQGQRIRFRYRDLADGEPASVRYELEDGDILIVE